MTTSQNSTHKQNPKNWISRARKYWTDHKRSSVVLAVILVVFLYVAYSRTKSASAETRYVLGTVSRATIVSSVSASGQVSATNQIDIKPKVGGGVVYVGVNQGDKVAAGTLIAELDTTDAEKSVRDAQANLDSARINLEKLKQPASELSLTQSRNDLATSKDDLAKAYTDSDTDISTAFLDLPGVMSGLKDVLFGTDSNKGTQWNIDYYENAITAYNDKTVAYHDMAQSDYNTAKNMYDRNFAEYQALGSNPSTTTIEQALSDTYDTAQAISRAVKSANALIQLYHDELTVRNQTPAASSETALTDLNTYTGKVNTHVSALLGDVTTIKTDKQNIEEKQQSLDQTLSGSDPLDIKSAELNVTKSANALSDANSNLANYYIRAPFSGTIAALNVKKYDTVSSGSAVATMITDGKTAELALNEVDAAKIKVGNKVTLTFDAIDGLSIAGQVASIYTIGTVSQGVVSYTVGISFQSDDVRIKPGMTVNAAIVTAVKQDVLSVPISAVKTQNNSSYVLAFTPPLSVASTSSASVGVTSAYQPVPVPVQTGISDDANTEIMNGLSEGEQIVIRSISSSAQSASQTSQAPSLFGGNRAGANNRNGGNAVFIR